MPSPPPASAPPPLSPCQWQGDPPEPELDDLAYQHIPKPASRPEDSCNWKGDPAEPELDDLAYQHAPTSTASPPQTKKPEPTPIVLPGSPLEEPPSPLTIVPTPEPVTEHHAESAEEPKDHHNELSAQSTTTTPLPPQTASPPREITPPPQLVVAPIPEQLSKAEREKKRREEKAREHDEKRRARKEKEKAKNELKKKERAERKTREREKREARDKEKQEKKAKKGKKEKGHVEEPVQSPSPVVPLQEVEPEPISLPPEERDEATGDTESNLPSGWQGLPTLNTLADGIRKILPKPGSFSKSRKNSKLEDELCPAHQLQDDIEHLNDHINQHLQEDRRQDHPVLDGASDPPRAADNNQLASNSVKKMLAKDREEESTAQHRLPQSTVLPNFMDYDCGHSSNARLSNTQQNGEAKASQQQSQPGRLKRASCLCGVMPPNSWELAAYDTPPSHTPRTNTPSQNVPFVSEYPLEK